MPNETANPKVEKIWGIHKETKWWRANKMWYWLQSFDNGFSPSYRSTAEKAPKFKDGVMLWSSKND